MKIPEDLLEKAKEIQKDNPEIDKLTLVLCVALMGKANKKRKATTPKTERVGDRLGEFRRVILTAEEMSKLLVTYQGKANLKMAIDKLDSYLEQRGGDKYKSHYAVLKRGGWVYREIMEHNE